MQLVHAIAIFLLLSAPAQAAMVSGIVTGEITFADAGNAFGLSVGNNVQLEVTYDDAVISGVGGETVFFSGTGNTMDFSIGSSSFDESMDNAGGLGPRLFFFDGALSEITYSTTFGTAGVFFSSINFFEGSDDAINAIGGSWDLASFGTTLIPIPPVFWLTVSGLLYLKGRRRVAAV